MHKRTKNTCLVILTVLGSALSVGSVIARNAELRLIEELRLGRIEGSGPDIFADIDDLAVDADGRIYVADVGWREVRLFDRDGRFVRRLAPEGDGPGERRYRPQGVSTRTRRPAQTQRIGLNDFEMTIIDHEPPQVAWAVSPAGELWGAEVNESRLWELSFTGDALSTISLGSSQGTKLDWTSSYRPRHKPAPTRASTTPT